MNFSDSSPIKLLSVYSPRRVKKLSFSPGRVVTFWRIVSLVAAFLFGMFAWHRLHNFPTPYSHCKHVNKSVELQREGRPTNKFYPIPKNINELMTKEENVVKVIALYGRNIWSKFDAWTASDWRKKCLRQDCSITTDASSIPRASAVVFNALQMPSPRHQRILQRIRRENSAEAKFVFLSGQALGQTKFDAEQYDLFFDYTITYKKDSDIRIPYWPNDPSLPSMFRQIPTNRSSKTAKGHDYQSDLFGKTGKQKFMLCILKSCKKIDWPSGFIRKIREEGVVDVYTMGKCQESPIENAKPLPCSDLFSDKCAKFIEQYKFVTISTDVFCDGYIPKEYWYAISVWQAVPVLWGYLGDNLIENTFINALSEEYIPPTFKRAAYASKDPEKYSKYAFDRADHDVEKFYWQCELCKVLHDERKSKGSLLSFAEFWDKEQDCGANSESYKLSKAQLVRTGVIAGS